MLDSIWRRERWERRCERRDEKMNGCGWGWAEGGMKQGIKLTKERGREGGLRKVSQTEEDRLTSSK